MRAKRIFISFWQCVIFACCVIANLGWLGFNETVETVSKDSLRLQNETFVTPSHIQWLLALLADRLEVTLGEEWTKYYAQILNVTSGESGYTTVGSIKVKKNDLTRKTREISVEVSRHRIAEIFWEYEVPCDKAPSAYELSKLAREVMEPFSSKYWGVAGFTKASNDEVVLERPLYCREDSSGIGIVASARYLSYKHSIQVMLKISGEKVNTKAGCIWRGENIVLTPDAIYSKTAKEAYRKYEYQERIDNKEREKRYKLEMAEKEREERRLFEQQEKAKQEERERLAKAREEAINRRNQSEAKVREQKGYANRFDSFCGIKFGASIGESAKRTRDGRFLHKTMKLPHAVRGCLEAEVYASVKSGKISLIRLKSIVPEGARASALDLRGGFYTPSINHGWVKNEVDAYNEMFRKRYGVELVKRGYDEYEYVCKLANGEILITLEKNEDDKGGWLLIEAKHYDFMNNSCKEFESESDIDLL